MTADDIPSRSLDAETLVRVIFEGSDTAFIEEYTRSFSEDVCTQLKNWLSSSNQGWRFIALLKIAITSSHGADTRTGMVFAELLLKLTYRYFDKLPLDLEVRRRYCASTLAAAAQARFLEGPWEALERLITEAETNFDFLLNEDGYWNARALLVRVLVRQNRVVEAKRALVDIQMTAHPRAPQTELAANELRHFERRRFQLNEHPPLPEQAEIIWSSTYPSIVKMLRQMREGLTQDATDSISKSQLNELDEIEAEANSLAELAQSSEPFSTKNAKITSRTEAWHTRLSRFLQPSGAHDRATFESVGVCLQRAASLHGMEKLDESVMPKWLADVETAAQWATAAGDLHGQLMLAWSKLLIYEKLQQSEQSSKQLRDLCGLLDAAIRVAQDDETRSNISNFFPSLAAKATRLLSTTDLDVMLIACELRKSRSLLATRADARCRLRLSEAGADALGARTHYLSYLVFEFDQPIETVLYTADGSVSVSRIGLTAERVRTLGLSLDPSSWNLMRFNPRSPRMVLAGLIAPVADALRMGRILAGDHLCIAADDPVYLVPLQYLPLYDRLAVDFVTMSRVASFSDAQTIASSTPERPRKTVALHILSDVKDPQVNLRSFHSVYDNLSKQNGLHRKRVASLTRDELIAELRPRSLIHIDAHGHFPQGKNPYHASGIVVSNGCGVALLDGDDPSQLLSPAQILTSGCDLQGSHVTLSACVSGLGKEGEGGDVLGLEFALRLQGATSLLATHWNVRSAMASTFCGRFYTNWLSTGQSRAKAWQVSTLELMSRESKADAAAEWCAFSLFGDWR